MRNNNWSIQSILHHRPSVLILRQNLQRFVKTFYLITPKREGRVMGDLDVETFLLLVSVVLERAEDKLDMILTFIIPLRTMVVGAKEEQ